MKTLTEIDNDLSIGMESLRQLFNEDSLVEICQFKLDESHNEIPWDDLKFPGIYLIEIKNNNKFDSFDSWVNKFKLEWEDEKYLKKFTPNLKKIRIKAHNELNDWIPIYIGKSKNIKSRVHGHIYKELNKTTFALKLLARKNLMNDTFKLSALKIEVKNYDALVPKIEWQLRNKINPIIGKQ
jgi:hypothetical protein